MRLPGVTRMTVIGRTTHWLHMLAGSSTNEEHASAHRSQTLMESLTHSLDMACRGYLCAPLVDCDPLTDPDCGPNGKKPRPLSQMLAPEQGLDMTPELEPGHTPTGEAAPLKF
jgi:hypothetical protein